MDWLHRYRKIRQKTEQLWAPLEKEDYVVQTMEGVSPTKWHLAHTTWFFENLILAKTPQFKPFHEKYNLLFNSYYQSFGSPWTRSHRGVLSRPTVDEVYSYRQFVDEKMEDLLETGDLSQETQKILEIGLHHEQQHQELLLMDIKNVFASNPLKPIYQKDRFLSESTQLQSSLLEIDGGLYEVGSFGDDFSYDNETPRHRVHLEDFAINTHPVTNQDFLQFIEDGGYKNFAFWHADAWEQMQGKNINNPMYWNKRENEWFQDTLFGEQKLNLSEPVSHINFFEASAYAAWSGKRLPTEFEWEIAAIKADDLSMGHFLEEEHLHPKPLTSSNTRFLGGLWEWTASAYSPYPGYKRPPGALGEYNSKFMINQQVLRGGSFATSKDHIRTGYRNFFQPEKAWAFTGFRLVETL